LSDDRGGPQETLSDAHEILARISDGCVVLDRDLQVTYANAAAGAVFGVPPDALFGRSLRTGVPGPVPAALRELAAQAMATGAGGRRQVYDPAAERWFEARLHPSPNELVAILADVTDAVRARAAAVAPDALTTGVAALSELPWGTHLCQFYERRQDQLDILVPYFRAGLEHREFCLWVLDPPLTVDDARAALQRGVADADRHLAAGDIEIVGHSVWSPTDRPFSGRRIIDGWDARLADALARGHTGMRVGGNPRDTWLTGESRAEFLAFERALTEWVAGTRVIVLCTYPLGGSAGAQIFDAARAHQYAVARRDGEWEVIEVLALAEARAAVQRRNAELEQRVAERTSALAAANEALRRQIRERERAEAALRESEELHRLLTEHTNDIILLHDAGGRRSVYVSPSFERLLGRRPDDTFGHVHPDDQPAAREAWRRMLAGEKTYVTVRHRHADGSWRWLETWGSRVQYRGVPHVMAVSRDITARRALEEQLRQAQKMEAVGQLAGGVAHDFNNLLTVITGYGGMLRSELPPDAEARGDVDEVLAAAHRAGGLTRQLLAFSRRQVLQPRVVDVNQTVTATAGMLRRVIGEDITLQTELAPNPWPVHADPGQLEQVVMNLAVNARDAMPHGGTLRLLTANVAVDADAARERPGFCAGEYAALTVEDTGTGIDPEMLPHLFEPFFTTKGPGRGTGLGLATVYGIVKQSGGCVHVDSTPGQGSRFTVYLPRHAGEPEVESTPAAPAPPRGTEKVLLVEDEASVRTATRRMLERLGYRVLEASDGAAALRRAAEAEARGERIDLVLTDVVMPEQGGRALGERLAAYWPGLRVLYMSGYTDDEIIRRGLVVPGASFLEKPFTPEGLAEVVRRALDQPGPAPRP
jgi:PAS domain S-box-containing protein